LQNQTLRHRPQRCSFPSLLPHARHEFAAGASDGELAPGAVVLGPVASDTRGAASASAALCACSVGSRAAAGAGVALPRGEDLALAVAEPDGAAPTTAQQLAAVLAAGVARARRPRDRSQWTKKEVERK